MFTHLIRTALRSIANRKLYSSISIFGLAVGMAVCILIMPFVNHERSFDTMHPDSDRVYRIIRENPDTGAGLAKFFNPMTAIFAQNFPEIETFTRLEMREALLSVDGESQYQTISMVDENFFSMFPLEVIAGDPEAAIADMSSAVLTEAAALRLYGSVDAIGEILTIDTDKEFRVSGIIANNPSNSHLVGNYFININNAGAIWNRADILESFRVASTYHYVKLTDGVDITELEIKTNAYIRSEFEARFNYDVRYQALRDIHFTVGLLEEISSRDEVTGLFKPYRERSNIFMFTAVGLLTLAIAAFNFVNLQIVQASKRAREIGIRRTLGAQRNEIAAQFLIEAILMSLFALIIAIYLTQLLTPFFKSVVAAPLEVFTPANLTEGATVAVFALLLGLIAGAYPAAIIAGLAPVKALKGELSDSVSSTKVRSILVVLQFSVSIGLIISTEIINKQIDYAFSIPLEFNPNSVVILDNIRNSRAMSSFNILRERLLAESGIEAVASSTAIPTETGGGVLPFSRVGEAAEITYSVRSAQISEDFFAALEIPLVAGRFISDDFATDRPTRLSADQGGGSRGAVVVNRALISAMGWEEPELALGEGIYRDRSIYTIVGVVEDARYHSIHSEIEPRFYTLGNFRNFMLIRLNPEISVAALQAIDRIWQQIVPDFPIQRRFMSDSLAASYSSESRTLRLFIGLSVIAVLLSCLGLYALASFIAERRTKEIGIRKVLGASVGKITSLLSWDFSKLVLIANLLAWPCV
ncbi:MAG: ABC transporter permease, partial [Robiginitomaculum sp.]|nr:ABC transporter permease [Robiginitomaculum sp.]